MFVELQTDGLGVAGDGIGSWLGNTLMDGEWSDYSHDSILMHTVSSSQVR